MVKLRMTTADVAAEVRCLRVLIGMRCANVYDLSPKTYVIKLAKSSGVTESGESEKALLLLESGVRLHTTEFARDKSTTPSGFTLKLRKHIRTRRLEDVRQLGIDRVVDLQFGMGEGAHHILLELYAQGNLLLTDADYNVLTLLRTHRDDEKGLVMMAHHHYPIDACRLFERTCKDTIQMAMADQAAKDLKREAEPIVESVAQKGKKGKPETGSKENAAQGKKGESRPTSTLKTVLVEALGYGPALCEHMILDAGLQSNLKISQGADGIVSFAEDELQALMAAVVRFEDWLESVVKGELTPNGYVYMQKGGKGKPQGSAPESEEKIYDEFAPLSMRQFEDRNVMKMDTFDSAMDEFFSKIEGQRADQQRKAQEESAFSKLDKIRADQTNRVQALKHEVDQSVRMAELIEYNLQDVDAAILAVRSALASSMDWKDLVRMVKEEKKAGNPVAGLIHSLQLEKNQITLLLSSDFDDMDDTEKTQPVSKVEVDLALSAHANARHWFDQKKRHAIKQEKTVAAHDKAFKAAEKKTQQQLAQAKSVAAISHLRKVHWFEKFNWFITSENYLVISGRDAQQNELVVKRYMKKGDLYVHADLHGASSTVIKNHNSSHPIPPLSINQAGCFTVCRSQAWDSKIVTSAWWVEAHQVSKTAPTGEYLTVGSFMVRGRKNFLPPNPLVMGFGLVFRLDESSVAAHLNERRVRGEGEAEGDGEAEDDEDRSPKDFSDQVESGFENDALAQHEGDVDLQELIVSERAGTGQDETNSGDRNLEEEVQRNRSADSETVGVEVGIAGSENIEDGVKADSSSEDSEEEFSGLDALLDRAFELRSAPKQSSSKYGLDTLPSVIQEVEPAVMQPTGAVQRDRPYMSKAERRKVKKSGILGLESVKSDSAVAAKEDEREEKVEKDSGLTENLGSGKDEKAPDSLVGEKIGRGRKGKLKKIKGKYAEQDDDERQLRMSLLALSLKQSVRLVTMHHAAFDSWSPFDSTTLFPVAGDLIGLATKVCYKCKRVGHLARDCPGESLESSQTSKNGGTGSDDQTRPDKLNPGNEDTTEKEIAALLAEENVLELGDDEREKLTELDSLTGCPIASDVLLYAVPVCGPYQALQGYKYRVKLTPGPAKKGKAAKTAVDVFSRMQEVGVREKELMKAITDAELVACMIGNVKITAPGLTKLKQSQKKGKKASSKKD
ncbi:unnamed protein product [Sphagnum troendelagicum]